MTFRLVSDGDTEVKHHMDTMCDSGMASKLVNDLPTDWQCNIILGPSVAKSGYLLIHSMISLFQLILIVK